MNVAKLVLPLFLVGPGPRADEALLSKLPEVLRGYGRQLLSEPDKKKCADLAGHDHHMQHLQPERCVQFFLAGSGGARPRHIEAGSRSLFAASANGFAVLEVERGKLKVSFVDQNLRPLCEHTITK